MTEIVLYWRIFMLSIVVTSIGLFCAALCISDAFIRSYWARKQQQQLLPRYRAKEILKVRNLLTMDKFTSEIERENPRPFFCKPPFDWS
jgi:hypothetical protein